MAQQAIRPQTAQRAAGGSATTWWRLGGRLLVYFLVVVGAAASMLPFVWTFLSSGKTINELYRYPPTWWPQQMMFVPNYI
ncbi:MAG TPA: hypothetical protein PKE45_14025, partial [Caldilineaceae bacterium]|nr:hypothetical protein [Caldilineaceae bacterium]